MKKSTTIILSIMYALTLTNPMLSFAAESTESGGELLMEAYASSVEISKINENEVEQQAQNNLIYTEITDAYNDANENISFNYAGGYVNEDGELVICASGKESTNLEIENEISELCSIDTSDIVVKKVKYSYEELEKAREDFENDIENYKAQAELDNSSDIYDLLSSITSTSIDDEFNKLVIYVPDLDENKLILLNDIFNYGDIVEFENDDDVDNELRATLRPGRGIVGFVSENNWVTGSIGYRARYKSGVNTYYGFCTAAHVTNDIQKYAGVKNVYRSDDYGIIGQVLTESWDCSNGVDAAFVCVDTRYNEFVNQYTNGVNIVNFCSNKWFTYLPKNATVYKVGATSNLSMGEVTSTNASKLLSLHWYKDVVKTSLHSERGDSGGLIYGYANGDGNGGFIPAGILIGGTSSDTYYSRCTNIVDKMNVYPY